MTDDFSKNWVWVPDPTELFVKGFVLEYGDGSCKVVVKNGAQESTREIATDQIHNCNPAKFNRCNDMAELTHLNEPSVVYNLALRYADDLIYTYSGLFLVAINPYKKLPIYDNMKLFQTEEKPPPHIFATAQLTFRNLIENRKNQLILVTGESGAGKTENTKKIIQYLLLILSDKELAIHERILRANPLLESFGNAKTVKNNNSLRFGKFIRISFDPKGLISGAKIDYYLLEKLRVLHQLSQERNYHVFYQLVKGSNKKLLQKLRLSGNIKDYKYISLAVSDIPGVDDSAEFELLQEAFSVMGFSEETTTSIFAVLAVILHLGNLDFSLWKSEQASFSKNSNLAVVADMLGISEDKLLAALLRPKVKAGREFVQKLRRAAEVKQAIDAFSKHLYEKLFAFVLAQINKQLGGGDESDGFIGVLDIAGFEIFDTNLFEQLCINYTNEKLQQFFNHHLFILEQSEYLREDIQWEFIDFGLDLQPTIDLIESKSPMGILDILDDQCILPKASDETFIHKLLDSWGSSQSKKFKPNKVRSGFIVDHYAGPVEYNASEWIVKNTDPVSEHVLQLLPELKNAFIRELLGGPLSRKKTVAQKHKEQLSVLMEQLGQTEPHFVRCILPNLAKKPNRFDKLLVLHQLRCNGVLEGIRIARAGYPNKMTFGDFFDRYAILYDNDAAFTKNSKTNSEIILKHIELDPELYKIGILKLFFKNGILGGLEESRDLKLKNIMTSFQSASRGQLARRRFKELIQTIQALQVVARNFQKLDRMVTNGESPWLHLFVNLKPLLEDSVKVLDSKEMNESLKQINSKLKDTENARSSLESENSRLKSQITSLEDEIMKTTTLMSEKSDSLKKLTAEEAACSKKLAETERQLTEMRKNSEKLAKEHAELLLQLSLTEQKLQDSEKEVARLSEELQSAKDEHEQNLSNHKLVLEKVSGLEAELVSLKTKHGEKSKELRDSHEQKLASKEKELKDLVDSHESKLKELVDSHESKLKDLTNTHETKLSSKEKEITELAKTHKEEIASKNREIQELTKNHASKEKEVQKFMQLIAEKEQELKELKSSHEKLLKESQRDSEKANQKEFEKQSTRMKALESELDEKKKEWQDHKTRNLELEKQLLSVQSELERTRSLENDFEAEKRKTVGLAREIQDHRDKATKEQKKTSKLAAELASMRNEFDLMQKSKSAHQDEILLLRKQVQDLQSKLQDKENVPPAGKPDLNLLDEFAQIKLKLNELHAVIRKEKFENQKLSEEVAMLRKKVDSSFELPLKRSEMRRSLALGDELRLSQMNDSRTQEELKNLRIRLKQEEANVTRAENYAIELQKKVNKLQMSRGLNGLTDYEEKLRELQRRVTELERQVGDAIGASSSLSPANSETRLLTPSNSFGTISSLTNLGDFAKIYKDITQTLRATRSELATLKKEILRLKALLRESEDELYEAKRLGVKVLIQDYEERVARLEVGNDQLQKKQKDLELAYQKYKNRSEEYFDKLELAELAVGISKRHELQCRKELEERMTELKLLKDEHRAFEHVIKQLRSERNEMESEQKKQAQKEAQLAAAVEQKEKELAYLNDNYGDKKHKIGEYKEEIRILRQDVKFRMDKETELIRANEAFKIENDELQKIKVDVLAENEEVNRENEELSAQNELLRGELEHLGNDKAVLERKLEQNQKQSAVLQGLLDENADEMRKLDADNRSLRSKVSELETRVSELNDELRETETSLTLVREHNEVLDLEKSHMREELDALKLLSLASDELYKAARRENLAIVQESETLKKVNTELTRKISELEEKLYSNDQLRYLESSVAQLTENANKLKHQLYEGELREQKLQKQVKTLEYDAEAKTQQMKKYNDENFNFHNMVGQYSSKVEFLQLENSEKELIIKSKEREIADLRERMLMLEKDRL